MAVDPLTTAEAVRTVYSLLTDDDDLDGYIESASMLVAARCVPLDYTTDEIEIICRYLTAHLWEVDHPRLARERMGQAEEYPESKVGLGLQLTRPGQQVLMLDYLGGLSAADPAVARKRVTVLWIGKEDAEP